MSSALRLCSAGLLVAAVAAVPTAPHAEAKPQILANWVKGPGTHNAHVFEWSEQNDPVMGGSSTGNYTVVEAGEETHALMQGTVRNVSFLHAPGYARITTIFPHNHLEDASAFKDGALQLVVRNGLGESARLAPCAVLRLELCGRHLFQRQDLLPARHRSMSAQLCRDIPQARLPLPLRGRQCASQPGHAGYARRQLLLWCNCGLLRLLLRRRRLGRHLCRRGLLHCRRLLRCRRR